MQYSHRTIYSCGIRETLCGQRESALLRRGLSTCTRGIHADVRCLMGFALNVAAQRLNTGMQGLLQMSMPWLGTPFCQMLANDKGSLESSVQNVQVGPSRPGSPTSIIMSLHRRDDNGVQLSTPKTSRTTPLVLFLITFELFGGNSHEGVYPYLVPSPQNI